MTRPPYLTSSRRLLTCAPAAALATVALSLCLAAPALAGSGGGGLGGGGGSAPGAPNGGAGVGATPTTTTTTTPTTTTTTATTSTTTKPPSPRPTTTQRSRPAAGRRTAVTPGELRIDGAGDGHGIGMSQYGAEGFALHGATAPEILAHFYSGTSLGHVSSAQTVRVLLADGTNAQVTGASSAGSVTLSPATTYTVSDTALGVQVAGPAGHVLTSTSGTLTVSGPGPLTTAGRPYRGVLQFSATGHGGVQTVNALGIDDYVRGVVAAEMSSAWAPAALEAQAIAARTYALTTSVDGAGFTLYDDTRSQMYEGVDAETAPTDAAVAATAGEVVTYHGTPVVTYFFASSGGETESIQNAWPGATAEPWLVGVSDPYDAVAGNPYHRWTVTLSLAAATAKLGSLVDGTLRSIDVTRRGVSPRVVSARVIGTRGTTTVTGPQLAAAFGLPSTWMSYTVG